MKVQEDSQKGSARKRSFSVFELGTSFGPRKRQMFEKKLNPPMQSKKAFKAEASEPTPECKRCYGPHELSAYKWTPGACYSCGQVGHKSSEYKNPILKPIFCFNYT